jgi:hypothetical protein
VCLLVIKNNRRKSFEASTGNCLKNRLLARTGLNSIIFKDSFVHIKIIYLVEYYTLRNSFYVCEESSAKSGKNIRHQCVTSVLHEMATELHE